MTESGSWKKISIHTDGACEGNPGPGGWAALLRYGDHVHELTGGEPATTNNRMELQAAISALKSLKEPCEITLFTDSEYLRGGITEWLPRGKANHWRTLSPAPSPAALKSSNYGTMPRNRKNLLSSLVAGRFVNGLVAGAKSR